MSINDEPSHTQIKGNASTARVGQTLFAYTDLNCLIFCTDCSLVWFRDPQKSPTPQAIWLQENLSSLFFKEVHSPYVWRKCDFFVKKNPKKTQPNTKPTKHKTNQDSWEFLMLRGFPFEISWFFIRLPCCREWHEVSPYIIWQSWLSTMRDIQV